MLSRVYCPYECDGTYNLDRLRPPPMRTEVTKGWFRRWHVYSIGHLDGDREWIATFRSEAAAVAYVDSLYFVRH